MVSTRQGSVSGLPVIRPQPIHSILHTVCSCALSLTQKVSVVPELSEECYITDDNLFTFFLRSGDIRFVL